MRVVSRTVFLVLGLAAPVALSGFGDADAVQTLDSWDQDLKLLDSEDRELDRAAELKRGIGAAVVREDYDAAADLQKKLAELLLLGPAATQVMAEAPAAKSVSTHKETRKEAPRTVLVLQFSGQQILDMYAPLRDTLRTGLMAGEAKHGYKTVVSNWSSVGGTGSLRDIISELQAGDFVVWVGQVEIERFRELVPEARARGVRTAYYNTEPNCMAGLNFSTQCDNEDIAKCNCNPMKVATYNQQPV